jgi:hypothetical protein
MFGNLKVNGILLLFFAILLQALFLPTASASLSNFTTRFTAIYEQTSLALSEDGKFQVADYMTEGVYVSSDYGWYWTKTLDAATNSFHRSHVAISADGSKIFAGTVGPPTEQGTNENGGYLYRSTDSGLTWTRLTSAGTKLWGSIKVSDDGTKLVAITEATTSKVNGNFVITQNPELFISVDSGITWTSKRVDADWNSVAISSDGLRMWASSLSSGAWLSINSGTTWTNKRATGQRSLSVSADGRTAFAIESSVVKKTTDTGTSWSTVTNPYASNSFYPTQPPTGIAISGDGKNVIYASNNHFLWLSNTGGASWIQSQYYEWAFDQYFPWLNTDLNVFISRNGLYLASITAMSNIIEANVIDAPSVPTPLVVSVANTSASLSWGVPASAGDAAISDYSIQYSTNGSTWTSFAHTSSTATSATISGLTNGTSYQFRVAAVNAWGIGAYETYGSALAPGLAPGTPTSVTGAYGDQSVALSWTAPSSNGGSPIRDYKIEYSADSGSSWNIFSRSPSSLTSETITGLTNGTSYIFRVTAFNDPGNSSPSIASSTITPKGLPLAPTSLSVTPGNTQVSIAFSAGANNGSALTDYIIEYSSNSGGSWSTFAHTASTSSPQVVTGLTNYVNYIFRLTPKSAMGVGATSQSTSAAIPRGTLTSIALTRQSVGNTSGSVFTTQPQITLKDQNFATLSTDAQTVVTASVSVGATIAGTTTATANSGVATFSGLKITGTGGNTYTVTYSAPGVTAVTQSITLAIDAPATINIALSTALMTAEKGKSSTINASVSTPGKVTFFANGKKISGCINKSASTSVSCLWRPAIQGRTTQLSAMLYPVSSSYQAVSSPILGIFALKRIGTR